jgi:23S rRNA (cytosine1962-C5)-methyltransferase
MIQALKPEHWSAYQLLDSGNYQKLEKFGEFVLARPEPQAVWAPSLSAEQWKQQAHATFTRDKVSPEKGNWSLKSSMKQQWILPYKHPQYSLNFRLGLSGFKHVGLFPEQAVNWDYIYSAIKKMSTPNPKLLNLFAYTGGASIAGAAAGADVTHVDAVKQVITWGRENMEASNLKDIRWVVEDAAKFVQREVKRGKQYQGIILDPPAYGRGPDGEKWVIETDLYPLLKDCVKLLDPEEHFFIINLYSIGFSSLIVETLVNDLFKAVQGFEYGELYVEDAFGKKLPLGVLGRFSKFKR